MSVQHCNRFVLRSSQRGYSPGVEGYGNYLTAIKRYSCSYPMMSGILTHALLLGTKLLPEVFLHLLICCTAAVFMLTFANWPLSLVVGQTMNKVRPADW